VNQHTSLEERIKAAREELVQKRGCEIPVFVDTMENDFNRRYDAWPERFFILHSGGVPSVGLAAKPSLEDRGFDRDEIRNYINSHVEYQKLLEEQRRAAAEAEANFPPLQGPTNA
jgi:hypothetical protein